MSVRPEEQKTFWLIRVVHAADAARLRNQRGDKRPRCILDSHARLRLVECGNRNPHARHSQTDQGRHARHEQGRTQGGSLAGRLDSRAAAAEESGNSKSETQNHRGLDQEDGGQCRQDESR